MAVERGSAIRGGTGRRRTSQVPSLRAAVGDTAPQGPKVWTTAVGSPAHVVGTTDKATIADSAWPGWVGRARPAAVLCQVAMATVPQAAAFRGQPSIATRTAAPDRPGRENAAGPGGGPESCVRDPASEIDP